MGLTKNSNRRLKAPNPYLILTGAVAASAAVIGGRASEAHSGHQTSFMPGVTIDGGKMYDDIQ